MRTVDKTLPYVVRDCDHIEDIAQRFGITSDAIREEPKNAALVASRGDLSMLAAGDVLYVTPPDPNWLPLDTGSTNSLTASGAKVDVRVNLLDASGPISGAAYTIEGLDSSISDTTDPSGLVKFTAPTTARSVLLTLTATGQVFEIRIGGLDPLTETTGVKMRLSHLGFYSGPLDDANDDHLQWAIQAFQSSKGLEPSGEIDDATRSALTDTHGS
jgi:N-acetylmuramoyl-L-alanine amidase